MKNSRFNPTLMNNAEAIYEEDVLANSSCVIYGKVFLGAYSYIGKNCVIGTCRIGRYCSLGDDIKIALGEHPIHHISTHPFFYNSKNGFNIPDNIGTPRDFTTEKMKPPQIGHDVWIGSNALITKGVTIGNGAVIAAGSVVTKDVEAYEIVGGTPAKHIKYRFSEEKRLLLEEVKWWNLPLEYFVGKDVIDIEKLCLEIKKDRQENRVSTIQYRKHHYK